MKDPKLTLVGAGPGDPELITLKGVKALESADVVLYDALVDSALLQHAADAIHVPVGKRSGRASVSQETINHLIVEYAMSSGHVVRLKGGDPFVFGRGMEEIHFAERFGIETDMVIGISSIMLPGSYGIPLTQRGINQSFTVVTATGANGQLTSELKSAARYSPTTVIFMGLGKLNQIVDEFELHGRGDLPVAIISNGSTKHEQVISSTVQEILSVSQEKEIQAPALLVFGHGAAEYRAMVHSINNREKVA